MENIKLFETYYFDDIYYTKEEILSMGLEIRSYESMRVFLGNISENYKILKIFNENKSTELSKIDILKNPETNVKDIEYIVNTAGDSLKIFNFSKYYGIDYDGVIYLASSSLEREEKLADLHNLIRNRVASYRSCNLITSESKYETQQKIINKKTLMKAILSK